MEKQPSSVQSVVRALNILSCFTINEPYMSVAQIAERLSLPKSTVVRLLQTLKAQQFIEQDESTQLYKLGFSVFELGNVYAAHLDLRQAALPIMKELNEKTMETVSISVVDHYSRVCIEKVESTYQIRNFVKVGSHSPLCFGASGKVLMSYLSPEEQQMIIKQEGLNQEQQEKLQQDIRKILQQGYALTKGERIDGLLSIATPIYDSSQNVIAGLSISGPISRIQCEEGKMIQCLREAAVMISRKMGYTISPPSSQPYFHR